MTWLRAHGRFVPELVWPWVMWSHLFSFVCVYVWTAEGDLRYCSSDGTHLWVLFVVHFVTK